MQIFENANFDHMAAIPGNGITTTTGGRMPTTRFDRTLSDEEIAYARGLLLALKNWKSFEVSHLPLGYVLSFLEVCVDEGKGVMEYAERAEVPPTVMTRHLLDIGDRNRAKEEGFGLITQERDKLDLRRHHARITPKGKALIHRMMQAIKTAIR